MPAVLSCADCGRPALWRCEGCGWQGCAEHARLALECRRCGERLVEVERAPDTDTWRLPFSR